jgi:ParB-like chromosome segregation protein Spo0J
MARATSPKEVKADDNLTRYQAFEVATINRRDIQKAPYNPRYMTPQAEKMLRRSLRSLGLVEPVVWNRRTGNLVGGHQRITQIDALEKRDDYDITVAVVDVDEHAEKKLNLALNNRNIQGDWDEEALADILRECSEVDYSDIGVTDADLEVLLGTVEGSDYRELLTEGEERKAVKGSLAEIKASEARMREKTADENVVDFYTVIVFESFQERDEFCEALGLHPGDKYIRGADLMRLLLVPNGGE